MTMSVNWAPGLTLWH